MLKPKTIIKHWDGNVAAFARAINITREAPRQWRGKVPPERVIDVARASGWKFTPHQIRPDLYPNPTDGMPAEVTERIP